jgi:alpha-beta hydrolase superfamily lysophospholipase
VKNLSLALLVLLSAACATTSDKKPDRDPAVSAEADDIDAREARLIDRSLVYWEDTNLGGLPFKQRTGYVMEAPDVRFLGCIIYLQGLGDSIKNHYPLFSLLSKYGFRVLAFDYLGQGGSEGSMNDMRVDFRMLADLSKKASIEYEIGYQAQRVWDYYSQKSDPIHGRNCSGSKKFVIGWSTGGLAAYFLAMRKWANAVALIAPSVSPRWCVGESAKNCLKALGDHIITKRTLTHNTFQGATDPHLDPIKPDSPAELPMFVGNLMLSARFARSKPIPVNVKGIAFLSGPSDAYVNAKKTYNILYNKARHFQLIYYKDALHEIDNEMPDVLKDFQWRIAYFFNSATHLP